MATRTLGGSDVDAIKAPMEALTSASHKMAEKLYQDAAPDAANATPGDAPPNTDIPDPSTTADNTTNVVDAEFEETN